MYLKTSLDWYEYMKMPIPLFLADIIDHYKLMEKAINGYVYMETKRAYMDCHKRVYLQTNYSKNVWRDTDTSNNPTHQAFGNMSVVLGFICRP